ncbi:MAG: hypothetical protein PHX80_05525 [Candidatus Nanoarchaeia archaeon]|nr:hypothetical protein [Candidatus Nanoarchaeia archaeon]
MSYKPEQIGNDKLKDFVTQKQRKILKKAKHRKIRRTPIDKLPEKNKYNGWAV